MDKIQKAANGFIEAGKDPAELLEFADATLHKVAFFIKMAVIRPLNVAIGFWWNHRDDGLSSLELQHGIRIVGFIHDGIGGGSAGQQRRRLGHIRDLAGGGDEPQGIAQGVDQDMNFAAEPAPGTAEGLIRRVGRARDGARRARVGAYHRAVEHDAFQVGIRAEKRQHVVPHPVASPARKATVNGVPPPLIHRQQPPLRAATEHPEHRLDEPTALLLLANIDTLLLSKEI